MNTIFRRDEAEREMTESVHLDEFEFDQELYVLDLEVRYQERDEGVVPEVPDYQMMPVEIVDATVKRHIYDTNSFVTVEGFEKDKILKSGELWEQL